MATCQSCPNEFALRLKFNDNSSIELTVNRWIRFEPLLGRINAKLKANRQQSAPKNMNYLDSRNTMVYYGQKDGSRIFIEDDASIQDAFQDFQRRSDRQGIFKLHVVENEECISQAPSLMILAEGLIAVADKSTQAIRPLRHESLDARDRRTRRVIRRSIVDRWGSL